MNQRHPPAIITLVLAAVVSAGAAADEIGLRLVLQDAVNRELYSVPVRVGDRFAVQFTHSYALSQVEEIFEVTGPGEFRLRETVYEDFGAGLPHEEASGQRMEFRDGRIRLGGYDSKFGELHLRVGHIANHRLAVDGKTPISLADLERPGGEVKLTIARGPPLPCRVE